MSNNGIHYTVMGSCNENFSSQDRDGAGTFQRCAWEPDDCEPKQTFLGTDQDEEIMKKCKAGDQPIGRCLVENQCALRAADCAQDTSIANFDTNDSTCTIQRDKAVKWDTSSPEFTQFGSCKDTVSGEHFCIYDPADCDESGTEVYATPSETLAAGVICDCSQVHVGACITDTLQSFCTIRENGCRDGWSYYSPHTQRLDRENGVGIDDTRIDCRLCQKSYTKEPTPAPSTLFKPTISPTKTSAVPGFTTASPIDAASVASETKGMSGTTGAIIDGITGGVVFLTVFLFFHVRKVRRIKESDLKDMLQIASSFVSNYSQDMQSRA